jgi:S1-C subfamily serine protease
MQPKRDVFLTRLIWLTLAGGVLIGIWRYLPPPNHAADFPDAKPRLVAPRGDLAAEEQSNIELFENSRDSVVFISTRRQVQDFWTRNVFSVPRGDGSGFIWDTQGHVVTNFHVLEGASEATVKLADGRDYKATLVGLSPTHDIAVLRIGVDDKRPPPVPVGSSNNLRVGQKVFAIGNPFGLDWTLTTGIVSALDRSLAAEGGRSIEHLIQTDAAINPGNSGGPLLDSAGRLIGMNTAIYSPSGASAGIGFAVPVDTVNRVVPQIIRYGKYVQPGLGIQVDEALNQRLSSALGIEGVVILRVDRGSTAADAGLRGARVRSDGIVVPGDIIVAVGEIPVSSVGKLFALLDDYRIGDSVKISVLRNGEVIAVPVKLQAKE